MFLSLVFRGQASNFLHFSVGDGLPFVQVSGITQAPSGALWLGGYGGIAIYNGIEFKHYNFRENLPHSNVTALFTVGNTLFVGTTKGLHTYRGGEFSIVDSVPVNKVEEVVDMGVINENVYALYKHKVSFLNEAGNAIAYSIPLIKGAEVLSGTVKNDTLLLGTTKGLFRVAGKFIKQVEETKDLKVLSVNGEKGITLGTTRGVYNLENNNLKAFKNLDKTIVGRVIKKILHFDSTTTFFVTEFGLNRCQSGDCEYISVSENDRSNQVNTLFKDREGNLWLGTNFGLYKYTANAFKKYGKNAGLIEAFVYGIDSDENGVWVAAGRSGIVKYAQKSFTRFGSGHGMLSGIYRDVLCTGDSVIAACDRGISVRTKNRVRNFTFRDNDEISGVNTCFKNSNGKIILCTKGGAGVFENGEYKSLFFEPEAEFQTWAGVEDDAGRYWFATYEGGLWIVDAGVAQRVDEVLGINGKQFLALDKDYKGNIWIGTFNGVYVYVTSNDSVIHFDEKEGLNSGLIYSFVQDYDSNIWIGTNQGINRVHLPEFYTGTYPNILSFGKKEGFSGVECNVNGAHNDGENLWFGTVDGLMKFEPAKYAKNNNPPVLSITGTKLFYGDTLLLPGVEFPHDKNHITFNFLGISLSNPSQVKYSFILEGFDEKWSPPDYLSPATYSGLPPGKYTFKVKSANSRGVWNDQPVEFAFRVKQHFTQTVWFRLSTGGVVLLLLWAVYYVQVRRHKVKRELERKLDSLKLKALRSQMNPHFIFNSMNSIQYFINHNEKLEANRFLSKFASLMRKMLNNSRQELIPLGEDLEALDLYLQLEKMRFEDKFDYELICNDESLQDLMIPSMVIQPFVENAIIHGFKKIDYPGKLRVEFKEENDFLVCTIDDNGRGLNSTISTPGVHSHKSASTGITGERMQTLTKLHKQDWKLSIVDKSDENPNDTGTKVEIKFPVTYI